MSAQDQEFFKPRNILESTILETAYDLEIRYGSSLYEKSPFIRIATILEDMYNDLQKNDPIIFDDVTIKSEQVKTTLTPILNQIFYIIGEEERNSFIQENGFGNNEIGDIKLSPNTIDDLKIKLLETPIATILGRIDKLIKDFSEINTDDIEIAEDLLNISGVRLYLPILREIIYCNLNDLLALTPLKNSFDGKE